MLGLEISLVLFTMLAGLLSGFGKTTGLNVLGIFTVTMLSLMLPAKEAVGILLPILLVGDIIAVTYYRRTVAWKHLFSLVPWILAGIVIGYFVLLKIDNEQLKILLGFLIIGLNLFQIVRDLLGSRIDQNLPSSIWFIGAIGILAGFATMIGNVAGAVMAVYLLSHRLPKNEFVGTGAWFFLFVNVIKVPFYIHLGMITPTSFTLDLMVIPAVLIGTFVGIKVLPLIPQQIFKWIILALGTLGAMRLIVPSLSQYFLVWHISAGIVCMIAGLLALFQRNQKELRAIGSKIYCIAYTVLFVTTMALAIINWESSVYLLLISGLSFAIAVYGYIAWKKHENNWRIKQISGVIASYSGVVTAVLITAALGLSHSSLSMLFLWLVSTIIGGIIILWMMNKGDFELDDKHSLDIKN